MAMKTITAGVIKRFSTAAAKNNNCLHIVPLEGKWILRKDGAARAQKIFTNEHLAVIAARKQVKEGRVDYAILHKPDGTINRRISA